VNGEMRIAGAVNADNGALSRCISAASFWTPIWVRPESEWLEHAPFGFWLVDALRPRSIVDLGTATGCSLAVFCQAVQTLDLDCRCYGIDQWQDYPDGKASGEAMFRAINDHNEAHYKSFSSLIHSDFEQARAGFDDGSIDLLHIDGFHSYKAILATYTAWQPRLSESSVVLFHDTNGCERGIGVARLWRDLAQGHKHFEFLHGLGLGVLGMGRSYPEPVERLFACANRPEATSHLRLAYSQLGSLISVRARCDDPQAQLRKRDLQHAQDQALLSQLDIELRRQSARQSYLSALSSLREDEIAKRDRMIEQLREQLKAQQASFRDQLKAQQDAFLNSTSWRVTAPLRSVIRFLRREGR
jgi:hypothetical protein